MNYLTTGALVLLYPQTTLRRAGVLQFRGASTFDVCDAPRFVQGPAAAPAAQEIDYVAKSKARGFVLYARSAELGACARTRISGRSSYASETRARTTALRPRISQPIARAPRARARALIRRPTRGRASPHLVVADLRISRTTPAPAHLTFARASSASRRSHREPARPAPTPMRWALLGAPPPLVSSPLSSRVLGTCHNPLCPLRGRRRVVA
ncbi:hypothetical protein FB451DRAFT_1557356 [Mycena latifolia]|nr:hypothetical protein FB451DRAFT_1557356 [Mycena latifolia]